MRRSEALPSNAVAWLRLWDCVQWLNIWRSEKMSTSSVSSADFDSLLSMMEQKAFETASFQAYYQADNMQYTSKIEATKGRGQVGDAAAHIEG
jgi:hypothetical protein